MTVDLLEHEAKLLPETADRSYQRSLSRTELILSGHTELSYPHFSSRTIRQKLLETQDIPEDDPSWKHKIMSLSDLELAATGGLEALFLQEHEVAGSIRGVVGHEISVITNELLRAYLGDQPLETFPSYAPKEDELIILRSAVYSVCERYPHLRLENIIDLSKDVWSATRKNYLFSYGSHNRKTTISGSQYSPKWVHDYWVSRELNSFENKIFEINRSKMDEYLANLFDELAFLPLQSDPTVPLVTEKPIIMHVEFGDFRIQFKGRIDYAVGNSLGIDTKFGSSDTLFSAVNRIQSLLYSHALKSPDFSKSYVVDLCPKDTLFYYHWYDTKSDSPSSYYIDGTVYPDEYAGVLDNLCVLAAHWVQNYEEFKRIKEIKEAAVVLPFLALPD